MIEKILKLVKQLNFEQEYITIDDIIELAIENDLPASNLENIVKRIQDDGIEIIKEKTIKTKNNQIKDKKNEAIISNSLSQELENKSEKNKGENKEEKSKFPTITDMMEWGIMSSGDIIGAKGTDKKAILSEDGDVYVISEKVSMNKWLRNVYGWESVATYRRAIDIKSGKTLKDMYTEYMENDYEPKIDSKVNDIEIIQDNIKIKNSPMLFLKTSNSNAFAKIIDGDFIVFKRSLIADIVEDCNKIQIMKIRETYKKCISDDFILNENSMFSYPSEAAIFVTGKKIDGMVAWKDEKGRSLKEIQL